MTPTQISKQLPEFSIRQIKLWRQDLEFKKYMAHLETKYMELIDNDINHLRRTATARLQEIVDIPYTSKNFEYRHFEWAVNKIFQITLLRDRTLNINQALDMREAKPAETPEQKNALKELMRVMGDNTQRYGQSGKLGEA
jgi:hypothetical protein